jgi:hypothetical protein
VLHAAFLSVETLRDTLTAWYGNDRCQAGLGMPVHAAADFGAVCGRLKCREFVDIQRDLNRRACSVRSRLPRLSS